MSEYTKEFDDWWYKPLLDSAKWNGGVPDKDMMRYKDLGKQSAFHAWVARDQEITRLKKAIDIAEEAIVFYEQASRIEGDSDEETVTTLVSYTGINRRNSGAGTIQSSHKKYGKRAREAQKQIKEVMEGK